MLVKIVSTLEEDIASGAMSARILGPEDAFPLVFRLEVNVELVTPRKGLVTDGARRFSTGFLQNEFLDWWSWSW